MCCGPISIPDGCLHFIRPLKLSEMQTEWTPDKANLTFFLAETMHYTITIYRFTSNSGSPNDKKMHLHVEMLKGTKPRWNNKRAMDISAVGYVSSFFFSGLTKAPFTFIFSSFSSMDYDFSWNSLILFATETERHFTMPVCMGVCWSAFVVTLASFFVCPHWMGRISIPYAKTNRKRIVLMVAFLRHSPERCKFISVECLPLFVIYSANGLCWATNPLFSICNKIRTYPPDSFDVVACVWVCGWWWCIFKLTICRTASPQKSVWKNIYSYV